MKTMPAKGVEVRENDIRFRFTVNGQRKNIPVDRKPTVANIIWANKHIANVHAAIKAATFSMAHYFPDAKVTPTEASNTSYGHYGDLWLKSKSELAAATKGQYGNAVKFWKRQLVDKVKLETYPLERLEHSKLAALVGEIKWAGARMRNNTLIALRGPISMWVKDDRRNRFDPTDGIENGSFTKGKPDPLTHEQAERVIARMVEKYPVQIAAYFEVAFFDYLRPEEEIALKWEKLDFERHTGRIDIVRTFKGGLKEPKTYEIREIEFSARGWAAIMRMKPLTFLKPHGHVFENPRTGKEWHDERSQRDHYWAPTLKALGIPARRAYCTRHTGITLDLAAGCDPQWVARKAGHKTTKMIWGVYTKWIPGHDHGSEIRKVNAKYGRAA